MSELALAVIALTGETWRIQCDGLGCIASVSSFAPTDREAIDGTLAAARRLGWRIEPDRFIRPRLDLCPDCQKANRPT